MAARHASVHAMTVEEALKHYFGFSAFRPGQGEIVDAVLSGRDTLAIMPTGGGKSLCYQLPALIQGKLTVVISPLIALMKDQVDALTARKIPATYINSSISAGEQGARIRMAAEGELRLVYIAPERFRDRRFTEMLAEANVAFVAVDEAHCVSMWGHDFRPDYLRIGEALNRLGRLPVAAFTATATPEVRADIVKGLNMRDHAQFVTGFGRPNLSFRVADTTKDAEKHARLSRIIEAHKTGIIYCATRKKVDDLSGHLQRWGASFIAYHGGMDEAQRNLAQERFISGQADVAIATNAFGMGIDRSDIRFVAHFEMPGSVEAYYQEAGRAGRDGLPAICEILFRSNDRRIQEFFIEGSNPSQDLIYTVYRELYKMSSGGKHELTVSLNDLAEQLEEKNGMAVSTAMNLLARQGVIERFDVPGQRTRGTRLPEHAKPPSRLEIDLSALHEKERRDYAKLDAMMSYCRTRSCRQGWILEYFGEQDAAHCSRCDRCVIDAPEGVRPLNEEETIVLRKALSGVARMCDRPERNRWDPKYGRTRIIEMLVGSKNEFITESWRGLTKLSTYGMLASEGTEFLKQLFDEMQRTGLIETTAGQYPLIGLTPLGAAVMRGETSVDMLWPTDQMQVTEDPDFDDGLFEQLKKIRARVAVMHGNQAPYKIYANKTLKYFAERRPTTKEEAQKIPGVGRHNIRYFKYFEKALSEVNGRLF